MIARGACSHAGLDAGCWLLEIKRGGQEELAKLHPQPAPLALSAGSSILRTTGLMRPTATKPIFETVRIYVGNRHITPTGRQWCSAGGRTRIRRGTAASSPLPETAFTCIGDFIAESLAAACEYGMREIVVACIAGVLQKYWLDLKTPMPTKSVRMDLLRAEYQSTPAREEALHDALAHSVSVRKRSVHPRSGSAASYGASPHRPPGSLPTVAKTSRCGCSSSILKRQFLFEKNG